MERHGRYATIGSGTALCGLMGLFLLAGCPGFPDGTDGIAGGPPSPTAVSSALLGPACIGDCTGKVCGDDGCGVSCGACVGGETCANGACTCSGTWGFDPRVDYPIQAGPFSATIGDVDGHGTQDILVSTNDMQTPLLALFNPGDGVLTQGIPFGTVQFPFDVAVADLDLDGLPDIVTAAYFDSVVSVYLNIGMGSFAPRIDYPTAAGPYKLAIGTLDGDPFPDIAVASADVNEVGVLLNLGSGLFAPVANYPVGPTPVAIALGDMDGDGDVDMAVAANAGDSFQLLRNAGNGHFTPGAPYPTGSGPAAIATADVDGDGDVDVAVTSSNDAVVTVFLNSGVGTFGPGTDYPTAPGPVGLVIGEFSGDGFPDLVTLDRDAGAGGSEIGLLVNDGLGGFVPTANLPSGSFTTSMVAGDLNGDGRADLAIVDIGGSSVNVLMSVCLATPPCNDGNPCTDDTWDTGQEACVYTNNAATCAAARCEGGTFYAAAVCVDGACPQQVPTGCDDGFVCTTDYCDPAAGCLHVNNTVPCAAPHCDNGVFHAPASCQNGSCIEEQNPQDCDDGNACTTDSCVPALGCGHTNNTLPCAAARCEGGTYYAAESCAGGSCPQQAAIDCDDGNPCTTDSCDPASGCIHANNTLPCAASRCDAGTFFAASTCTDGACPTQVFTDCDDDNLCTTDSCDPASGCGHVDNALPCAQARCDNGVFRAAAACLAGACPTQVATDCDDGNACTTDSCDPATGCGHADNTLPCAAARCDNGTFHAEAACSNGTCPAQVATDCDDGNACTNDSCVPASGCGHADNTLPCAAARCDNGTFHAAAACSDGACPAQVATDCDDGNLCTTDSCDPATGCGHADNTLTCGAPECQGAFFRPGAVCTNGTCVQQQMASCDDANLCTTDSCDPSTGCEHADNALPCAAARCEGLLLYAAATCQEGACAPQQPTSCDDQDPCTNDSCEPGQCGHAIVVGCCVGDADCHPSGECLRRECLQQTHTCDTVILPVQECCTTDAQCDDDDPATVGVCDVQSGTCMQLPRCLENGDCDDEQACTTDHCDTGTGRCTNVRVPDCCADSGICPDGQSCQDGTCVALPDEGPADTIGETVQPDVIEDVPVPDTARDTPPADVPVDNPPTDVAHDLGPVDTGFDTTLPDLPGDVAPPEDLQAPDRGPPETLPDVPIDRIQADLPPNWSQGGFAGGCSASSGTGAFPLALIPLLAACLLGLRAATRRRDAVRGGREGR